MILFTSEILRRTRKKYNRKIILTVFERFAEFIPDFSTLFPVSSKNNLEYNTHFEQICTGKKSEK